MGGLDLVLVLVAGVLAGTVNTVVGAGTLITFPLLVALGVPPLTANVSNTVGLVPASVTGAWGYRRELRGVWGVVGRMAVLSAIGGVAGGLLLLVAPAESFTAVVPWLLVLAAVLAAVQPRVAAVVRRRAAEREAARAGADVGATAVAPADGGARGAVTLPLTAGLALGVAATGVYGGYFGAAQGVVLLALLGIGWTTDLHRANGAKNVLAGVANLVSATVFVVGGVVDWRIAGLVAVGSAVGGVIGARVGRRLPAPLLRGLIVVVALTAAVVLWVGR
ncbi:sulfite exporter TauE/SafE family protein [Actinotalea solisilvae]|uniref:sulfite exporter TauE/SafE family protein n=1 Tax=Actinotalea solisilvae TaxID=2072922 RepID=UPI0018F1DD8A|nr:sulfite exporter TauE/SafE family protein [Actinotalea solisilvae]